VYGDASGNCRQTVGGTDYDIVNQMLGCIFGRGLSTHVQKANPSVTARVLTVNARLQTAAGESSVFVSPKCKELILDFEQVTYSDKSREINKTRDTRRTHLSDALGYLVWEEFRPQQPIGEQGRRLL
jgi:hypothetical protein